MIKSKITGIANYWDSKRLLRRRKTMSNYKVLTTSDDVAWKHLLRKIKGVDIYFTPEYCRVYEKNKEGMAYLFVFKEGEHFICYPYMMRKIRDLPLPHVKQVEGDLYEIFTPYGYGGPITNVSDEQERKQVFNRFSQVFGQYCKEQHIVSEFVRFHPVIKNHGDYLAVEPTPIRNTVVMDLTNPDIMSSLTTNCRNRVRYAQKNGLTVYQEDPNDLETFIKLYYETMDKNNAETYYYFSMDFFNNLVQLLEKDQISLFVVKHQEKVIASAYFLHYNDYVTYHLTGSIKEYLKYSPYNLLISYAANCFREQGYKSLHLGGGYKGNDDLFRFKNTFSKQPPLDFYIGRKIHCYESYQLLIKDLNVADNYFPLYRHPSLYLSKYANHF
jgi:hypothetical protein